MEAVGTLNAKGNAVLQSLPRYLRVLHEGTWVLVRRYLGEPFTYSGGTVQTGNYMGQGPDGYLLCRTPAWCAQNPTQWEIVK